MADIQNELRDFADLMVDEVIAKVRIQLAEGQPLSLADQQHMIEQLARERSRNRSYARRQALEEAAKAVRARLYPVNQRHDWTQYAHDRAEACDQAVAVILSLGDPA